jgi:hypothetical protein
VPDRLEQSTVVEPINPFQGRERDGFEMAPRPSLADDLGFNRPMIVSASALSIEQGKPPGF